MVGRQEGLLFDSLEEREVGTCGWPPLEGQHIGGGWGLDVRSGGCLPGWLTDHLSDGAA